eukprot:scaffold32283_cov54-Attheya_sp.AAC.16
MADAAFQQQVEAMTRLKLNFLPFSPNSKSPGPQASAMHADRYTHNAVNCDKRTLQTEMNSADSTTAQRFQCLEESTFLLSPVQWVDGISIF